MKNEKQTEYMKEYYKNNKIKILKKNKIWIEKNKEKRRLSDNHLTIQLIDNLNIDKRGKA
jgi:hypothetical protein